MGFYAPTVFIILGVVFSLLPDIDFIFHLLKKKRLNEYNHKHRDYLHYPILYIGGGFILFLFVDVKIAILFAVVSALHFLHDSVGIGWGVKWLYPFSKNSFMFCYKIREKGEGLRRVFPSQLYYSWTEEQVEQKSLLYGDKDWVKNIYLKFSWYAFIEYIGFLIGLGFLFWL